MLMVVKDFNQNMVLGGSHLFFEYTIGGCVALGLTAYLLYALLFPGKF